MILYEYPFNERIRTYLRLEHLLRKLSALMARDDALDHHFALLTIFEVMDVAARSELKSEVLKDLERQKQIFLGYRGNPAISQPALDEALFELGQCFANLNALVGKLGQPLTENEWLMSIRSRAAIPGGTCEFDLPAYHAWQHTDPAQRRANLQTWAERLMPMGNAVCVLLRILRDTGSPQRVMASNGQYQLNLPPGRSYQLLRLEIDPLLGLIPEISGNRLIAAIRLMKLGPDFKLQASKQQAPFDLTLCV